MLARRKPQPDSLGTMADPAQVSVALADEIKRRRLLADLSQAQLASDAHMRTTVYQRIEYHERGCSIRQLIAIANALSVSASEILGAAEERVASGDIPEPRPGAAGLRQASGIDE